jgi:hypothetical protein
VFGHPLLYILYIIVSLARHPESVRVPKHLDSPSLSWNHRIGTGLDRIGRARSTIYMHTVESDTAARCEK